MHVTSGLFEHMVIQRTASGVSDALVEGTCEGSGEVFARVTQKGKAIKGLGNSKVGSAARGKFKARIKGIPIGGPYDIELAIGRASQGEPLVVKDVLVGDVWLLGGQSNMQGCGWIRDNAPVDKLVRAFFMDDRWATAVDPIHNLWQAVDEVHADLSGGIRMAAPKEGWGGCPGPSFGQEMRRLSGVPQGLIACAHGGTSMSQWDPALKKLRGKSLYGATLRRIAKNGGKVAGMVWYQGCSETNAQAAEVYTSRMKRLVAALRRDTGCPRLPWVIVQIARVVSFGSAAEWNSIQEQQRRLSDVIANLDVVPAIDLPLDDLIHISGPGQWRLGKRLASTMATLTGNRKAGPPPIRFKSATVETDKRAGTANVRVEFDHVVGSLRAPGLPTGFQVTDNVNDVVFRVDLHGQAAVLKTTVPAAEAAGRFLHYGKGCSPVCNITDAADRSLPVMGPISLGGKARALLPFQGSVLVSTLLPSAGRLETLDYPDLSTLKLEPRSFGQFCDRHVELEAKAPEDVLVYFVFRIDCPQDMRLHVSLGYDGPVKAWLDAQSILHDPNGTNPANQDIKSIPVTASAGKHELIVALGSNNGKAWGIFLGLERRDIPARLIKQGPGAYRMPRFI